MALTTDIHLIQYGTPDGNQLTSWPLGATQQVWHGGVALLSGGTGATKGYLKNAATPAATDVVVGMIGAIAGGTGVSVNPGIVGGATDGSIWIDVQTGAFFFQSGSGSDQLSETTAGLTVYYGGESATGVLACATNGGSTRPVLGIQLAQDPGIAGGVTPGPNYFPIILNTVGGP